MLFNTLTDVRLCRGQDGKLNQAVCVCLCLFVSLRVRSPLRHKRERRRAKRSGGKESGEEAPTRRLAASPLDFALACLRPDLNMKNVLSFNQLPSIFNSQVIPGSQHSYQFCFTLAKPLQTAIIKEQLKSNQAELLLLIELYSQDKSHQQQTNSSQTMKLHRLSNFSNNLQTTQNCFHSKTQCDAFSAIVHIKPQKD